MRLEAQIKAECADLGFSAARIASVGEAEHARAFRSWLDNGYHGEMSYLARDPESRTNAGNVLEGSVSAIVVAMPQPDGPPGSISRYARSEDYHEAIWARLNALLEFVQAVCPGAHGRGYADTTPILERDLAASCGLGWIGKNTCLITPGVGSRYFLGELLLDVALEPDVPIGRHCGSCTRCLDACPTGAFVGPYVMDACRCISYLTIELKGSIPVELRPLIGRRVFGCDVCQDVCPHNRKPQPTTVPKTRSDMDNPALVEYLAMDDAAFRERFRNTPVLRAKRRGFLRNVCVALGNERDIRAVPALQQALGDREPLIREHASWALHCILGE